MKIQEFHAALENAHGNVSFLESLRMMATSHAEQTALSFAEGTLDDFDIVWNIFGPGPAPEGSL